MFGHRSSLATTRGAAAVAAVVTLAALTFQLNLTIDRMTAEGATLPQAVWRYLGFFTMLANAGAAAVAGAMALRPSSALAGPRTRMTVVSTLVIVGTVNDLLMRPTADTAGWQVMTDHALHEVTPVLFVAAWLLASHGSLKWHHASWAVVPPLAYAAYALTRGTFDGWYAYWFLDPTKLTLWELTANSIVIMAGFVGVALVFVLIDWWIARRSRHQRPSPSQ